MEHEDRIGSEPGSNGTAGDPRERYQVAADQFVAEVLEEHGSVIPDLTALENEILGGLMDRASLEFRQVLTKLAAELQLAAGAMAGEEPPSAGDLAALVGEIHRAEAILNTHLDTNEVRKLMIRLDPRPFDLAEALDGFLRTHGLAQAQLEFHEQPLRVVGDRGKLTDAVGQLIQRFSELALAEDEVKISFTCGPAGIEGFIGLRPARVEPDVLVEALGERLSWDDAWINVPYVRSVIERHGGSIHVENRDGATGFQLVLPSVTEEIRT